MGLNQDLVFEVSKNVEVFGGAPENDERNYGHISLPIPSSLTPLSYSLEIENNKEKKEKKGGVGEEIGHMDNFPRPTRMCLFRENRKGHG